MPRAGRAGELTLSSLGELERDVRELLAAYVAKVTPAADTVATPSTVAAQPSTSALTFAALRELWIERQLSLLHHAKPQATCIEDYTQTLFSIALGVRPLIRGVYGGYGSLSLTRALRDNTAKTPTVCTALLLPENCPAELAGAPMAVCHGAIFITYLLYFTQVISPKVKVYLPLDCLEAMVAILKHAQHAPGGLRCDAAHVVRALLADHAFMHGAVPLIYPLPKPIADPKPAPAETKPQRIANRYLEQGLGHIANWEELDAICRQYGEVRRQMFVECMPEPEPASAPMEIEVDVPGLFPSTTFAASVQKCVSASRPEKPAQPVVPKAKKIPQQRRQPTAEQRRQPTAEQAAADAAAASVALAAAAAAAAAAATTGAADAAAVPTLIDAPKVDRRRKRPAGSAPRGRRGARAIANPNDPTPPIPADVATVAPAETTAVTTTNTTGGAVVAAPGEVQRTMQVAAAATQARSGGAGRRNMPSFAFGVARGVAGAGIVETVEEEEEEEEEEDSDTEDLMRDLECTMDVEVVPEEPAEQNDGMA